MKKNACIFISLLVVLLISTGLASGTVDYSWQGYTLRLLEIDENPMFAPADIKDDERPIALKFEVPQELVTDRSITDVLYESIRLKDASENSYKSGAALLKDNTLTYLFAVPKTVDSSSLRLAFDDVQAEDADGLEAVLGKWLEKEGSVLLPGDTTWDWTAEQIIALYGQENVEQEQLSEGVAVLIAQKTFPPDKEEMYSVGYAFQQDEMVCALQAFEKSEQNKGLYEEICAILSNRYGETNLNDFNLIAPYLKVLAMNDATLKEAEASPWKGWMLPDQKTLVCAMDMYGIGVVYLNTERLAMEKAAPTASDSLETPFGKWDEAAERFIFPGEIIWDSGMDDIKGLLINQDLEETQWSEDMVTLDINIGSTWDQGEMFVEFAFRNDEMIYIIQQLQKNEENKGLFDETCLSLSNIYGESRLNDLNQISLYLEEIGIEPDAFQETEGALWRAWMLPEHNTLVLVIDFDGVGVAYFNTEHPKFQKETSSADPQGFQLQLGKWCTVDNCAALPGRLTWEWMPVHIIGLYGKENVEQEEWLDDMTILVVDNSVLDEEIQNKDGEVFRTGFVFRHDKMISVVQFFEDIGQDEGLLNELTTTISNVFGEPNIKDVNKIIPFMVTLGIDTENITEVETETPRAWMLQDNKTIVWCVDDGMDACVFYFNVERLQGK